ncbi:MAG: hypothetical protein DHS20C16_32320 [Phycisphaerae bacterium]|nr:MAG: hypothetical protein DHS20C16_32320 [Phycisphaerae bacterium]
MLNDSIRSINLRLFLFLLGMTLTVVPAMAADREAARHVSAAIKAYESGDYEKAQQEFTEAELKCPECPEIAYNRGLASYRQRDFVAARDHFNSALQTRDLGLEAKAKYNLGNVAYSEALEKMSDLKESIELARSAIFHYRDALEVDPNDLDARANIETAQLLIKDLLDKQKQEQEKQDQQNQQNQDQQDQDNQDQQDGEKGEKNEDQQKKEGEQDQEKKEKQDGEQGDEEKDQQSEQQEQNKDQQNKQEPNDQQQSPQDQQQQAGTPQERKLTDEELAKLLQAVRDKEAQRRKDNKKRLRIRQVPVQKDW